MSILLLLILVPASLAYELVFPNEPFGLVLDCSVIPQLLELEVSNKIQDTLTYKN